MRAVRVPRKPVVLIAVNSHEMPAVPAGLDQSWPRPSLAGHLLTRMGGAGERFGPDYIWVSWVGGKDLAPGALTSGPWPVDADALHRYLLDHSPCAGPVKNETGRRHSWVLRGTVRTGVAVGRHPMVHMPVQSSPAARSTAVPPGPRWGHDGAAGTVCGARAMGSGRARVPGGRPRCGWPPPACPAGG